MSMSLSQARQITRAYYGAFVPVIKQLPGREGFFAITTVDSSCGYPHLPMPRTEAIILQRDTVAEVEIALGERCVQIQTIRAAYEAERRWSPRRKAA